MNGSFPENHHTRGPRLNTLYNVRDLGGYAAAGGRQTQSGRFLRADAPVRLDAHDLQVLFSYPVRTVIDLRSRSEIVAAPSMLISFPEITYHNVPLLGDDMEQAMAALYEHSVRPAAYPDGRAYQVGLADLYLLLLDKSQALIGRVMNLLADAADGACLINCSHGKDRTGLVAALLLLLAGVDETNIVENYQVSASLLQPWFDTFIHEVPAADRVFFNTDPENMRIALDHLVRHYGSAEQYLGICGVSPQQLGRLKSRLLDS